MKRVVIDYTNHRGERSKRVIEPLAEHFHYARNDYHTEPQWLLDAFDVCKGEMRTFAVKDIHSWQPFDNEVRYSVWRGDVQGGDYELVLFEHLTIHEKAQTAAGTLKPTHGRHDYLLPKHMRAKA
jgi:predicted DNA-binding transcriptional regulator YafY